MDLRELKEILQILEEKEITEFELEEEGMKLRIRKAAASPNHSSGSAAPLSLVPTLIPSSPNVTGPVPLAPAPAVEASSPVPTAEEQGLVTVKSPIVGTFYRAPDPGSLPCAAGDCFVNLVLDAHDRAARRGNRLIIGADRPDGSIAQDKGRLGAVVIGSG